MSMTYGAVLAISWWAFTVVTILGFLMQHYELAVAITILGFSGLVFTAFAALISLRDSHD